MKKGHIVGMINMRLSNNYNKLDISRQNSNNTIVNKLFILIGDTTMSSIQEINDRYTTIAERVIFDISKYRDIQMVTCHSNVITFVNSGQLMNFYVKQNKITNIGIKNYENSATRNINKIFSEILNKNINIISLTQIDNTFVFLIKNNNHYGLVTAKYIIENIDHKLTDICYIRDIRTDYINILYELNLQLISIIYHYDHIYILANCEDKTYVINIIYYRMFNKIGYDLKISKPVSDKKYDAFVIIDNIMHFIVEKDACVAKIQVDGESIELNKIEYK